MILAQPILIAIICFLGWFYFTRVSSRKSDRFLAGFLVLILALLVLQPNLSTYVANLLGVTRGVDLLFYFFALFVMFSLILISRRIRDLERSQTQIVRLFSIMNAQKPNAETRAQDSQRAGD